jgi:hypothetical protein
VPAGRDGSRAGIGARRKYSSWKVERLFTSGKSFFSSNEYQYLIQIQRLQVEKPKVRSEGAINSRAGLAGFFIDAFSR